VVGRHQRLAAGLGPLDRLARAGGPQQADDLLGVDLQLAAEAAADVGSHHAQLVLGHPGDHREHDPQDVRHLGRGPHRVVVALRLDDDRAGLHERRDQPLLHEPAADHDLGVGEGLVGVGTGAGLAAVEDEVEAAVGLEVVVGQLGASATASSMSSTAGSGS
jgi:hypothetical protein